MKILIVEDSKKKQQEINEKVSSIFELSNIEIVNNSRDAKKNLLDTKYDICFIDLQIPVRENEIPNKNEGVKLIKTLETNHRYKVPKEIIIISEYDVLLKEIQNEKILIHMLKYEENSIEWEEQLEKKLALIKRSMIPEKKSALFAIHGMNTRGTWKNDLASVLTEHYGEEVVFYAWDYGKFTWEILFESKRKQIIEKFKEFYDRIIYEDKYKTVNVIAHSFGTYVIYNTMKKYDYIKFDKIIFIGSPLDSKLDWEEHNIINRISKILFYICKKDYILDLAKLIKLGNAGKKGFEKKPLKMEYKEKEKLGHSELFSKVVMKNEWLPFIFKN